MWSLSFTLLALDCDKTWLSLEERPRNIMTSGKNKKIKSHQFSIMVNHPVYTLPISALSLLATQGQRLSRINLCISEFSRVLDTPVGAQEMFANPN